MKTRTKKIFAWLMTFAMLLSLLPATGLTALAATTEESVKYIDADGTEKTQTATVIEESDSRVEWTAGWYVVNSDVTITGGADVSGEVNLILADEASLTISGVAESSVGICVSGEGNSLTIYGQSEGDSKGKLTVTGGTYAAGIGGNDGDYGKGAGSNITINGGEVTANGGGYGAGIGGGYKGSGSDITINGGEVTATGGTQGAGIGGGYGGSGGSITINGGTVTATGGTQGAGIGGGDGYSFGGGAGNDITIKDGEVTAKGGDYAAGIGGGCGNGQGGGVGSNITIEGGKVTAKGGKYAAGIGGAWKGSGSGITINGGAVTANGGGYGAGIGGGLYGSGGNIKIATFLTVKADGNNPPTTTITNTGDDLAKPLEGKRYVAVKLQISVTGTKVDNKEYDGTTAATATLGTVSGIKDGDDVTVTPVAEFEDANAGEDKVVEVTYTLSGDDAGKYIAPDTETMTANITRAKVEVPTAETSLVYNGEEQTGVELPDNAVYTLKDNTGTDATSYTATATLKDKDNYIWNVAEPTTDDQTITWSIARKSVTVDGIMADGKTYDGNTAATLNYSYITIDGLVSPETLTATATGTFEDENAGNGKNVIISNITLADKPNQDYRKNYELATSGNQTGTTADIEKFTGNTITVTCADIRSGETPAPTATAIFGDITYSYSKDGTNWGTWEEVSRGSGTYRVKAAVAETANYNGCESIITFRVISSSGGGGSSVSTYQASVTTPENGSIKLSPTNASKGSTVTITLTPDEGYTVDTVTVKDANGNTIDTMKKSDTSYTFTMPAGKVTVSATFKAVETAPVVQSLPFTDINADDWFYDAVSYVYEKSLMNGVSGTEFAPCDITSRAMVVTILWRMAGSPIVDYAMPFTDVPADEWYTEAVRWACSTGVVKGISDTEFAPGVCVTREALATMIYRCEQSLGNGFTGTWMFLLPQSDADQVSEWADEAMHWCVMKGIINGDDQNKLNPQKDATRAEIATIFRNLDRNLD